MFGEPIKLQGHISFPLFLYLYPFMTSGVGIKSWGEKLQKEQVKLRCEIPKALSNHFSLQSDVRNLNFIYGPRKKDIPSKEFAPVESECSANVQAVQEGANLPQTDGCLKSLPAIMCLQSDEKVTVPPESNVYLLVSVVEHFGKAGSGHYTVYISVGADLLKEDPDDEFEPASAHWFFISDTQVHVVSEKDVLAAEASLLFYEKLVQG